MLTSTLLRHFSSRKEAYQALLLDSFHRKMRKGIYQLVSGKNVCRVQCMGDRDRIIWNSQQKRFVNERSCCSYCAHIRRVNKKEEGPHYIINGNSNLRHNDDCKLHECLGNTTVRRRVLSKMRCLTDDDDKRLACRKRP